MASELIKQILDEIRGGDDADELGAGDDGEGVEGAAGEEFGGFTDGAGFGEGDGALLHDLLQGEGVIERGIDGAFVGVEGVAKADAEDVGPGDDADELVGIDDGDVMDAVLADEGADFGDGIAVVGGDHIAGHEVGDGIVAFHG